jgi:hypothetical protein
MDASGALTPSQCAVHRILCAHAFHAPECFPSRERIAQLTGLSVRQVARILHELRELGVVTWKRVRPKTAKWAHNVYTILTGWQPPNRRQVLARFAATLRRKRACPTKAVVVEGSDVGVLRQRSLTARSTSAVVAREARCRRRRPKEPGWERAWELVRQASSVGSAVVVAPGQEVTR